MLYNHRSSRRVNVARVCNCAKSFRRRRRRYHADGWADVMVANPASQSFSIFSIAKPERWKGRFRIPFRCIRRISTFHRLILSGVTIALLTKREERISINQWDRATMHNEQSVVMSTLNRFFSAFPTNLLRAHRRHTHSN